MVLIQAVDMHHSPLVEWLGSAVPREKERIEIAGKSMSVWHVVWHPISADKRGADSPEAIVTLVCAPL